jgi:hypothetical protein
MNTVINQRGRLRQARRLMAVAVMVSLGIGMAAGTPSDTTEALAMHPIPMVPVWLRGVWTRHWILVSKVKSNTLDVHYLQTPTYFVDIRIPKDRPAFSAAKSFADLTDADLRLLGQQQGFTGLTTLAGDVATWTHDIQFQPSDGSPDTGRLQRIPPDRMHEHGLDGSYIESWKSLTNGKGRFLVIRVAHGGRLIRTLVVAGDRFIYVRNRATDLPPAASFDALIDSTKPDRKVIEAYLDCEFSVGRVTVGSLSWVVEHSTLPWREGKHLGFIDEIAPADDGASPRPLSVENEQWTVPVNTMSARDIKRMFEKE